MDQLSTAGRQHVQLQPAQACPLDEDSKLEAFSRTAERNAKTIYGIDTDVRFQDIVKYFWSLVKSPSRAAGRK